MIKSSDLTGLSSTATIQSYWVQYKTQLQILTTDGAHVRHIWLTKISLFSIIEILMLGLFAQYLYVI